MVAPSIAKFRLPCGEESVIICGMKTKANSAFTLLEMLVVVGIIGVLMGVIISQFGGATESAKAAKCEANIRNLVTAMHSCAMSDPDGNFPPAGSFIWEYPDGKNYELVGHKRVAWIAGAEKGRNMNHRHGGTDPMPFSAVAFNGDDESVRHALTNGAAGAMWKAMAGSRAAYQCPVHADAVRKETGRMPGWSFAMNRDFGCEDASKKKKWWGKTKDSISNASKLLMFAELQGADFEQSGYDSINAKSYVKGGVPLGDAILEYKNGETIGFNHKTSKRGISGHVAFADGHVERLFYPRAGSGISLKDLTEALCLGHEISFDGKGYTDLQK